VIDSPKAVLARKRILPKMSNVFQRSLEDIADQRLADDSKLLSAMWQVQLKLNAGFFAKGWVDALVQTHSDRYDIYDAFGFAMLWSALLRGEIIYAICDIQQRCAANRNVSQNHGALSLVSRILGPGGTTVRCNAAFYGNARDNDGYFEWYDRLDFSRHENTSIHDCSTSSFVATVGVGRGELPLEVGDTKVGTTCGHIFGEGGLVRWPYGSTQLYLFYLPSTQNDSGN